MEDQPSQDNRKNNSKLKKILLIGFIVLAVTLVFLNNFRKQTVKQSQDTTANVPTPVVLTAGSFSFQPGIASSVATNTKELNILASSDQKSIVSYDIVLKYDKAAAEILTVESLVDDFDLYPLSKSNYFVITGVKKIDSTNQLVLDQTPLLKLKLILKKPEGLTLSIVDSLGKEKSQLVDDKSTILKPESTEFKLEM